MINNLKRKKRAWVAITAVCAALTLLTACAPGGDTRPKRKTLPVGNGNAVGINSRYGDAAFSPNADGLSFGFDVTVPNGYALVQLPNADRDKQTAALVNSFKPEAVAFLSKLADNYKGVAIDLSNHRSKQSVAWLNISKKESFSIPVMLIWDKENASRLSGLEELADGVSGINLDYVSGEHLDNCFGASSKPSDF